MDVVKVGRSEIEGCVEEERVCHGVGHPSFGQRMLTSAGFYRAEIESHNFDCHCRISGCMNMGLHAQREDTTEAYIGSKHSQCIDYLLQLAKHRMDQYCLLQVAVWGLTDLGWRVSAFMDAFRMSTRYGTRAIVIIACWGWQR